MYSTMCGTINDKTPYFNIKTTSIIKGIALIMMFIHHFYTFPSWWIEGTSYPIMEVLADYIRLPMNICVSLFCFLTGYFYFFNEKRNYKYSLKKISDILVSYWFVFIPCAIIAAVFIHYDYSWIGLIEEGFALVRPTMYFCWYVIFYIVFMLILPLLTKIMTKNIYLDLGISFVFIPLALRILLNFVNVQIVIDIINDMVSWFPTVLFGYIFACYAFFEKMERLNKRAIKNKVVNTIVMFFIAIVVPMGRYFEPCFIISFSRIPYIKVSMDIVYTPLFIYAIANICKSITIKPIEFILSKIGEYSLLMWFVSCIFFGNCGEIFKPILYWPINPILVIIWGLVICFGISFVLDLGIKPINKLKNKLIFKK